MFGIRLMMIITIVSFAGAAALECFIRLSAPDRGDEELPTPIEDLKAGIRFLVKDRPNVFKLLLFSAALNFVLIGYSGVGFPYTIRTVLGFNATVYGIADGLIGVSGVAGAFIAGLFAAKLTMRWLPGLMATRVSHGSTGHSIPAAGRRMDQAHDTHHLHLWHNDCQLFH